MSQLSDTIRVFVNANALELPAGSDVGQAIATYDPSLVSSISSGSAYVTDARGIEVEAGERLVNGAILRVVRRAKRGGDADS